MQELFDFVVSLIPYVFSSISLFIAIAVWVDSRKKERTRQVERMTEALSQCHRLLEEIIRMIQPHLKFSDEYYPGGAFVEELILKGDVLNSLSWNCKHLGEDIRNVALILKSLVPVKTVASAEYLSKEEQRKLLDNLATVKKSIADYLKELHQ